MNDGDARGTGGGSPLRAALDARGTTYIVGIAGDSGSGKSMCAAAIRHILGDDLVSVISLDDYHIYGREERKALGITPLSPRANDLARLERDVARLREGLPVEKMVYDHATGRIVGPFPFSPRKILILEGLHAFSTEKLREYCDFTLFIDPDPDVKREWKLKRDTKSRGYTDREVRDELAQRARDYAAYVAPQRPLATVVAGISFSRFGRNLGWEENVYRVSLGFSRWDSYPAGVSLSLDIRGLFLSHGRPFLLSFSPPREVAGSATLELDGFLPQGSGGTLLSFLEEITGRNPSADAGDGMFLTPTTFMYIFLSACIASHIVGFSRGDIPSQA
ncbi:MAG: uridine kinase [Methanolinea sp.]|nr:uridine kinase [Methanolinea sp.]